MDLNSEKTGPRPSKPPGCGSRRSTRKFLASPRTRWPHAAGVEPFYRRPGEWRSPRVSPMGRASTPVLTGNRCACWVGGESQGTAFQSSVPRLTLAVKKSVPETVPRRLGRGAWHSGVDIADRSSTAAGSVGSPELLASRRVVAEEERALHVRENSSPKGTTSVFDSPGVRHRDELRPGLAAVGPPQLVAVDAICPPRRRIRLRPAWRALDRQGHSGQSPGPGKMSANEPRPNPRPIRLPKLGPVATVVGGEEEHPGDVGQPPGGWSRSRRDRCPDQGVPAVAPIPLPELQVLLSGYRVGAIVGGRRASRPHP